MQKMAKNLRWYIDRAICGIGTFSVLLSAPVPIYAGLDPGYSTIQEAGQEPPNYLPDILKKLGSKGAAIYSTNQCDLPQDEKLQETFQRLIVKFDRVEGKSFMKFAVRTFAGDDETFKSMDQQALEKAFGRGNIVGVYNVFGSGPWGEGTDNDNYILDNSSKPTGMGTAIDGNIRMQFARATKCVQNYLEAEAPKPDSKKP